MPARIQPVSHKGIHGVSGGVSQDIRRFFSRKNAEEDKVIQHQTSSKGSLKCTILEKTGEWDKNEVQGEHKEIIYL